MEQKIYDNLINIGYEIDNNELMESLSQGLTNIQFSKIINYLTNELRLLSNLDEEVNALTSTDDTSSFLLELNSFLKEIGCPYNNIVESPPLLLDYLLTELMGARISLKKVPSKKIELKLNETSEASNLKNIITTLQMTKPPEGVSLKLLFDKLIGKIESIQKSGSAGLLPGDPICSFPLTPDEWTLLESTNQDLLSEYLIRRKMLLKRLDCTIQSLLVKVKTDKSEEALNKFKEKRKFLTLQPEVKLSDVICARTDAIVIETSKVGKNSISKVMIGQIPDRGGRPSEQAPPPPEMPSWQQRQAPSGGGRGSFRGGARGRGDFKGRGDFQGGGRGSAGRGNRQSHSHESTGHYGQNPFDAAGSYSNSPNQHQQYSNNYQQNSYGGQQQDYNQQQSNYDRQGNYQGSSGNNYGYQSEPKRAKTFDDFQNGRNTYADQYVQESNQNQQWQRNHRGGGRGSGRGNRNYY